MGWYWLIVQSIRRMISAIEFVRFERSAVRENWKNYYCYWRLIYWPEKSVLQHAKQAVFCALKSHMYVCMYVCTRMITYCHDLLKCLDGVQEGNA